MAKYELSLEAQNSLKGIKSYSLKTFGARQTEVYLKSIQNQMKKLSRNPTMGMERKDLKIGYYSYFVGSHTIYYLVIKDNIVIIDVLHQSMEPSIHLF